MTTTTMSLFEKHEDVLNAAIKALAERTYYTPYPEHPKAYPAEDNEAGRTWFATMMNQEFNELNIESDTWIGEEVSPFLQTGIGISYPSVDVDTLVARAKTARSWKNVSVQERAGILVESLARVEKRYFDIAYATMHTTGQSFMMSFQASGPHGNDRALEAVAMGVQELTRFPSEVEWVKPMGKFDLTLHKTWKAQPKGIGLVVGCSTFPTWNTVPGMYASLITGNPVIVKPHPKSILPIAIVIAELRKVLVDQNMDPNVIQMGVDTVNNPITKALAEHPDVAIIDYTGGNTFGNYIEGLGKLSFTEKAGVNNVIVDSVKDLKATVQNIGFSASLYSGQMCTAPQNIFVPADGIATAEGQVSFDQVAEAISGAVSGLVNHPKMGAGTLGSIQNDQTIKRITDGGDFGGSLALEGQDISNPEFEHARIFTPRVVVTDATNADAFAEECFGPIVFVVKTKDRNHSVELAAELARTKGALTCLAYSTDEAMMEQIEDEMNAAFTPVSFNFSGAAFVNQHAAFSDFHGTGGNPAGNASFTNPDFINRRFVWVGNRYLK